MPASAAHATLEDQRQTRIRTHIEERLHSVGPLLEKSGLKAVYADQGEGNAGIRQIPVVLEGSRAGTISLSGAPDRLEAASWMETLVEAWSSEAVSLFREEALLEELSASWESLEALYEVSSSL